MTTSQALFTLAVLLLLAGPARAGQPDQELNGPALSHAVARCIKKRNCLSYGWHSVCAKSQDGQVGAFPNRCFMRCANKDKGVHWEALYDCEPREGFEVGQRGAQVPGCMHETTLLLKCRGS